MGLIQDCEELYLSLKSSEIIISEVSTVLFESLFFCKNVFLFNSSYTKAYFDQSIKYFKKIEVSNFNNIYQIQNTSLNSEAIDYYWISNWRDNFSAFLASNNLNQ